MIGKAGLIKTKHIFDRLGDLDRHIIDWKFDNTRAEIINMQFSTHYCHSAAASICSVFIIYKEETP